MAINTCPTCGSEMRPLAFSVYCPNDCDRDPNPWKSYPGVTWVWKVILDRASLPKDAARAWMIGKEADTIDVLRCMAGDRPSEPGWPISGSIESHEFPLLVFKFLNKS